MTNYPIDHSAAANLRTHFDAGITSVIEDARYHAKGLTKRGLWECACAWDGVSVEEHFVVFSIGNPYAAAYDAAVFINPETSYDRAVVDARTTLEITRKARRRQRA